MRQKQKLGILRRKVWIWSAQILTALIAEWLCTLLMLISAKNKTKTIYICYHFQSFNKKTVDNLGIRFVRSVWSFSNEHSSQNRQINALKTKCTQSVNNALWKTLFKMARTCPNWFKPIQIQLKCAVNDIWTSYLVEHFAKYEISLSSSKTKKQISFR